MKFPIYILTLIAALVISTSSLAAVDDGTAITSDYITPLANWVEQSTHVPMPFLPIAVASDRKLEKALHLEDAQHAGAMGAYVPGRLVVSSTMWEPGSLVAQSYVLHELVHHAQFISGKTYPCHAAKEREAYILQSQWLTEHGLKPLVTKAWIDKMSSCASADTRSAAD
jgi:hypothetical protein